MPSRSDAIARATDHFDTGAFEADLARRVAIPSESQTKDGLPHCARYLVDEMAPAFTAMRFETQIFENPIADCGPILLAQRHEVDGLPTMLGYGHGDVIRGLDEQWTKGAGPWTTARDGDRLYGRGTADNKGQHSINMAAMDAVLQTRGALGFNAKFMIETGEENGSTGVREVIEANMEAFAADVFIASDGPRVRADQPTVSLGARGAQNFDLVCSLREGGHHSGNWGGALADPAAILSHAIATIVSPKGQILVEEWLPPQMSNAVRDALRGVELDGGPNGPEVDRDWGEPGLTPAENVYAWNSFAVLAMVSGNPQSPVNAIAPKARAHCQLRYISGTDVEDIMPALRRHLDAHGFSHVEVAPPPQANAAGFGASRTELDDPWAIWVRQSIARGTGQPPAIIPQMGGSICNDLFTDLLDLPAIWIPHSYTACSQHAPDEHVLLPLCREALGLMAGLYWDLGDAELPKP
ncbi:MAG: M20 family metallopeptidase [Paracoccaceae bacterium]|nr:M20 family metallopeptidase [Paracoccaceae bacterium]